MQKIIQGDCLEVMKTFPDKSFDLVLTDPPYGMSYQSSWRIEKYDKIEDDDNLDWFPNFIKETYRILRDNAHCYIFCNDYAISYFRNWMKEAGFEVKRALVWVKNNHTSGDLEGDYGNKTEFVVWGHKGRRTLNGNRDTNVLHAKREQTDYHPTQKPIDLMAKFIHKSSIENETVFDPYAGSATTLLAAKQLGRKYIGVEISEKYCKIAEQRLRQEILI